MPFRKVDQLIFNHSGKIWDQNLFHFKCNSCYYYYNVTLSLPHYTYILVYTQAGRLLHLWPVTLYTYYIFYNRGTECYSVAMVHQYMYNSKDTLLRCYTSIYQYIGIQAITLLHLTCKREHQDFFCRNFILVADNCQQ